MRHWHGILLGCGAGLLALVGPAHAEDVQQAIQELRIEVQQLRKDNADLRGRTQPLELRLTSGTSSTAGKPGSMLLVPVTTQATAPLLLNPDPSTISTLPPVEAVCAPPAANCREPEPCLWFNVEGFRWKTRDGGTPFVNFVKPITTANGITGLEQGAADSGLRWDEGGWVSLSYRFHTGWDLSFEFLYFRAEGTTALGDRTQDTDSLYAALADRNLLENLGLNVSFRQGFADEAVEKQQLRLYLADVLMARAFQPTPLLDLRVFSGFRYANLEQEQAFAYFNVEGAGDPDRAITLRRLYMDGYGVRVGLDAEYRFGHSGFGIFGRSAVSLLYAVFESTREDEAASGDGATAQLRGFRARVNTVVPILDLKVGIRYQWKHCFVAAGYDFSYWFNMRRFPDTPSHDDIFDTTSIYRIDNGEISFDGYFLQAGIVY